MVAVRRAHALLFLLVLCLSGMALAGPTRASSSPAKPGSQVYVVAGVLVPVAVVLDGETLEQDVSPKSVLGPLSLTAGSHTIEFSSDEWSVHADFQVNHPSVDVVVHRPADAGGDPRISVFTNDVRPIAAAKARLTIAHTAVVPPADVRVSGKVLFANIANGEFVSAEVPAKTYSVDIVPTGESTPLLGPLDLAVKAGALNRVFAIGQPQDGSMDAIVQVIPLRTKASGPPASVDAGSAGLVAPRPPGGDAPGGGDGDQLVLVLFGLLATGLVTVMLAGRLPTRSRRRDVPR
jgi:Domain of unknown function (DUF4397)